MDLLTSVEKLFKDLIWDLAVERAIKRLIASLPFKLWNPLAVLLTKYLIIFADQLFDLVKMFIDISAIKLRNKEHQKAFDNACVELKIIGMQKGVESDEFKKAREKNRENLSKFARFDVAR